jgi:hypothetical protein
MVTGGNSSYEWDEEMLVEVEVTRPEAWLYGKSSARYGIQLVSYSGEESPMEISRNRRCRPNFGDRLPSERGIATMLVEYTLHGIMTSRLDKRQQR